MTPQLFAFLVMPGAMIAVGLIGYAVIVATDGRRSSADEDRRPEAVIVRTPSPRRS